MKTLLLVTCIIIGVMRFSLPSHGIEQQDIFKDVSHLFVGGLFGAAICAKTKWELWAMALGLTLLEMVAFFS